MDILDAIQARHSVRQYTDQQIDAATKAALDNAIQEINHKANLHIQAFYQEPNCFNTRMAHYGKFKGVQNYIALVGPKSDHLEESLGYYGEQMVLKAQTLGLNTCWVALTHGKSQAQVLMGEKEVCLIALGYGSTNGHARRSKSVTEVSNYQAGMPEWFLHGVEVALLAPTAVNQQKFYFELQADGNVTLKMGRGFNIKIDKGIVKYHFELGSGKKI